MDPRPAELFHRADAVFEAALDVAISERAAYLDRACDGDAELRARVERLLRAHDRSAGFLDSPAAEGAARLLKELALDERDALPATQQLGPFRIVREVGRGGMGAVYHAERVDGQFSQRVAIKLIRSGIGDEELVGRFLQERRILAGLEHPCIARLVDGGVTADSVPWFAMEFVDGQPITHYALERQLGLQDRLRLFSETCAAVQYAHEKRVIHRDLKPGNILVTASGTVKLLDFGIAKLLDSHTATPEVSPRTAHSLLTPEYAAPEQLRGEPTSTSTDVYALGVVLYELIVGERPHRLRGCTAAEIERIVCETDPPRPSLAVRRVNGEWRRLRGDLDTIVLKAMHKERARRYGSVAALLDDLRRYAEERPVLARSDSFVYRAHRYVRRHRSLATVMALLSVTAGLGGLYLKEVAASDPTPGREVPVERERLVVADFDVIGPDAGFGPVLGNTLRRYLSQSQVISVVPHDEVLAAVRLMGLSAASGLDQTVLRRVAQRERLGTVVTGEFARRGNGHQMTVRLVSAATGEPVVSFGEMVEKPTDLFPALARVALQVRGARGESVSDLRADPGADRVTTASFAALLKFTQARQAGRQPFGPDGGQSPAMALMRQAIALDSNFAMAHHTVAVYFLNNGVTGPTPDSAITKAYELRDRLPPRERVTVTAFYYRYVLNDRPQAAAEFTAHLARDSTDLRSITNLSALLIDARQFARAEAHHHAFEGRLESSQSLLLVQGKLDEADSLAALGDRTPGMSRSRSWQIALAKLDFDSAAVLSTLVRADAASSLERLRPAENLARIARVRGRLAESRQFAAEARELRRSIGVAPLLLRESLTAAREDLWFREDAARAVARLDAALRPKTIRSLDTAGDIGDVFDAASVYAAAGRPEQARMLVDVAIRTASARVLRATYAQHQAALAEIALAENRPEDAISAFRASDLAADGWPTTSCTVCVLPHLARTAQSAGWTDSARVFWERYVSTIALQRLETDSWFLPMAYGRLSDLYAASGDRAKAVHYQQRFLDLWRSADSELQPQVERARRRLARLTDSAD